MGKKCCVGGCDNDNRYLDKVKLKGSAIKEIKELDWHKLPPLRNDARLSWITNINKGRDFKPTEKGKYHVCSIHFENGRPTEDEPYPTLFMTATELKSATPVKKKKRKRRRIENQDGTLPSTSQSSHDYEDFEDVTIDDKTTVNISTQVSNPVSMQFCHLTREYDVRFYTGCTNTGTFKSLFDFVLPKASMMHYWEGPTKHTQHLEKQSNKRLFFSAEDFEVKSKPGRSRKLSLEQELLLTLMRLRHGLLTDDLAFRFQTSATLVSRIFITWIKLLSKELSCLIIWPSRGQISETLPSCYRKYYSKVRTIIDCSEVFVETPSSLEVQAMLWSEYKKHCTFKFLIAITPNGAVSWLSPMYGGRASDKHIVRDSGFYDILEPFDQVMADRGFKLQSDLAMVQCYLTIPPSAPKGPQMCKDDVRSTSRVANVRIFVEQAIKRIKDYKILKTTLSLLHMPIFDDIVRTCAALVNLLPPLTD